MTKREVREEECNQRPRPCLWFFFRADLAALVSDFFDFTFPTALQILTKFYMYMYKKQVFSIQVQPLILTQYLQLLENLILDTGPAQNVFLPLSVDKFACFSG